MRKALNEQTETFTYSYLNTKRANCTNTQLCIHIAPIARYQNIVAFSITLDGNKKHNTDIFFVLHAHTSIQIQKARALFQSLRHVRQCDSKCLQRGKWILEIQSVGVTVYSSKLHHLKSKNSFKLCVTNVGCLTKWFALSVLKTASGHGSLIKELVAKEE